MKAGDMQVKIENRILRICDTLKQKGCYQEDIKKNKWAICTFELKGEY